METEIEERNSAIADIFVEEFDAPVQVLTADEDENGVIHGNLISAGNFYTYAFDEEELGIVHHEKETQLLNDYAQGLLNGYGIKTDSIAPYEYTFGLIRVDAQVRCTKGGTPCGKVCLPKGAVCRKYGGGGTTGGKLKSGGGGALAAGIAGGVAAVGGAAAVGGLAYLNRKNLATGGKAVGERLKRAATEGHAEIKTGLGAAKESLKAGFKTAKEMDKSLENVEKNVSPSDKSNARLLRRSITGGVAGAGIGGAVGAATGGAENAARVAGKHLKAAGKDIKTTAKNSVNTTARAAKNVKETFFGKKASTKSANIPEEEATRIHPKPIQTPQKSEKTPKRTPVTVTPVPPASLPAAKEKKGLELDESITKRKKKPGKK